MNFFQKQLPHLIERYVSVNNSYIVHERYQSKIKSKTGSLCRSKYISIFDYYQSSYSRIKEANLKGTISIYILSEKISREFHNI